jgi:hypothetical protein
MWRRRLLRTVAAAVADALASQRHARKQLRA